MRLLKEIRNLLGNYHVKSGIYHYYRDEYQPAVDFFTKALREDPPLCASDRRTALHYLTQTFVAQAQRFLEQDDLASAVRAYERAAQTSPNYPDIRYRLGRALERMGRTDASANQYEEAARARPDYVEAHVALGFVRLERNEHEASAAAFRRALDLRIGRLEAPFAMGLKKLESDRPADAEDYFREVFLGEPRRFDALFRAAMAHLKDEEYEKSLQELDAAREIHPRFPDLPNYRGIALAELDRLAEAVESFREATRLSPHYDVPRLNLAFTLSLMGEYRAAEKELELVLDSDPDQPAALAKLEELRQGPRPERRKGQSRGASA